jgi:transcriptional regulator with XRE-family HTH domain
LINKDLKSKDFLDFAAINRRILNLMAARNISRYALSEAIDYSEGNLSRVFKGESNFSLITLAKISKLLNVSMDYLAFEVESELEREMRLKIEELTKERDEYKETAKTLKESMIILLKSKSDIEVSTEVSTLEKHIDK